MGPGPWVGRGPGDAGQDQASPACQKDLCALLKTNKQTSFDSFFFFQVCEYFLFK